jgi:hypothetical protein
MGFNFAAYDYTDQKPSSTPVSTPVSADPPKQKAKSGGQMSTGFNFAAYDYTDYKKPAAQPQQNPAQPDTQAPLSTSQKIQDAEDYNAANPYAFAQQNAQDQAQGLASFGKGALSGASLGLSEEVPGLSTKGDDSIPASLGNLAGAALPFTGASKLVGKGLQYAPKALGPFQKFMQAFGTGSTYETGKQAANYARGEEVDLAQIPKTGGDVAAIEAIFGAFPLLYQRFTRISPENQAKILESGLVPENLPKSQYETAENVLALLKDVPKQEGGIPRPKGVEPPPLGSQQLKIDPKRVTPGEDIGLRPTPAKTGKANAPDLIDEVGDLFSKEKHYNTTKAGKAIKDEVSQLDEEIYKGVNEMYDNSRALNSQVEGTHPELASKLQSRIEQLSSIPDPSNIQRRMLNAAKNIQEKLVKQVNKPNQGAAYLNTKGGAPQQEFIPINNQVLIEQIQSLRQMVDFEFSHGDSKNIIRPLINDLKAAVKSKAIETGNIAAAEAIEEASAAYKTWAETFDNNYINPFRDRSNKDYSKLFKGTLDLDESNMVGKILDLSDNGKRLADASKREIVENHLSKYFENPLDASVKDFNKSVRELEAVITPEQAKQVTDKFKQAQKKAEELPGKPFAARKQPPRKPTNDELIAAKQKGKKPEDIQAMMNSRSGIKELRQDLNTPDKRSAFERLKQQKIREIMRAGNIEADFTGEQLYKHLNKGNNFELMAEMIGEAEAEALRLSAKDIGKQQAKAEFRRSSSRNAAKKIAAYKTFELLFNLL